MELNFITELKHRRDELESEIEADSITLRRKQGLLAVLNKSLEYFAEAPIERTVGISKNFTNDIPEIRSKEIHVTENLVYQKLKEIGDYARTVHITRKIFPYLEESSDEFATRKLEVSSALTRLKNNFKVERRGPAKKSEWIAKIGSLEIVKEALSTKSKRPHIKIEP